MSRAHTTTFRFQDEDYFVANLDNGGVRIGFKGTGPMFDIPAGHAYFDRIAEATTRVEVEDLHDELVSAYS